jgi:hypothetical protein
MSGLAIVILSIVVFLVLGFIIFCFIVRISGQISMEEYAGRYATPQVSGEPDTMPLRKQIRRGGDER